MWNKNLLVLTLLILSINVYASEERQPKECNYSVKTDSGVKKKTIICNDFDRKTTKNYTNVCMFDGGKWKYGSLKYIKLLKKHTFTYTRLCDNGITVKGESKSKFLSPHYGDYLDTTSTKVTKKGDVFTSHVTSSELPTTHSPDTCYRDSQKGVSVTAHPCSLVETEKLYCEFLHHTTGSHRGYWWVQYKSANKKTKVICKGGIVSAEKS